MIVLSVPLSSMRTLLMVAVNTITVPLMFIRFTVTSEPKFAFDTMFIRIVVVDHAGTTTLR